MNCYGSVDPWGAVYFGVCFLALISSVCGLCVDAPTSGLRDLCSFHLCGDNVTPRSTASAHKVFCRAQCDGFWWQKPCSGQRDYTVSKGVFLSKSTSVPGTVAFPLRMQPCQRQLTVRTGGCFDCCQSPVVSVLCPWVQCLQGRELEAPHHILAQELLSQFPCVCLEASRGSLCSTASKGNLFFWTLHRQLRAWDFYYYHFLTLQRSIFLKQGYIS